MPSSLHWNRERGHVDHVWLKTAHSFSFARYVNPDRMNFGALLVLNEDHIAPGQGFGEHFHDNMEIVTIPLSGSLQHQDSLGNGSIIRAGDVQIMSAGTGIMHSEVNPSDTELVHLLQIWILPHTRGLKTRYDQQTYDASATVNTFFTLVAPSLTEAPLQIFQHAWISLGNFTPDSRCTYKPHDPNNGIFLFVIDGAINIEDQSLHRGDAYTCWEQPPGVATVTHSSQLLVIEVPMRAQLYAHS